jgi:hypothetical protein
MTLINRICLLAFALALAVVVGGALLGTPAAGALPFIVPFGGWVGYQIVRAR